MRKDLDNLAYSSGFANTIDMIERTKIKAVFFDAGGTLFETRGSVGEIYHSFAGKYQVVTDPIRLQREFEQSFRRQPPLAFSRETPADSIAALEKGWWRTLVREVFAEVGPFPAFDEFFDEVYEAFGGSRLWRVFDGVESTLEALKGHGLKLGVISNFDSRLFNVLEACGLRGYFDSIHVSTLAGAAKPAPEIFREALLAHGLEPSQACHIGDHPREDVEGAIAVGMRAILLDHHQRFTDNPRFARITHFEQLLWGYQ